MPPRDDNATPVSVEHKTLCVAIEISRQSWVVGVKSPASQKIGLHSLGPADVEGVRDLIENQRAKTEQALGRELRVLCCYEAGYEGFWPARWLEQEMSIETVVLDPASLQVNRKAKQRKTSARIAGPSCRPDISPPIHLIGERDNNCCKPMCWKGRGAGQDLDAPEITTK